MSIVYRFPRWRSICRPYAESGITIRRSDLADLGGGYAFAIEAIPEGVLVWIEAGGDDGGRIKTIAAVIELP